MKRLQLFFSRLGKLFKRPPKKEAAIASADMSFRIVPLFCPSMTIEETLVHLSRWAGYRLNAKELSVVEYFNMMKQYGKENKQK